jgi:hypothetical protein
LKQGEYRGAIFILLAVLLAHQCIGTNTVPSGGKGEKELPFWALVAFKFIEDQGLTEKWRSYLQEKPSAKKSGEHPSSAASPTLRFFLRSLGIQV